MDIEAERARQREEIDGEIDVIVAEMHALLPRNQAKAIGIAYARYSTEFQHSIGDQVRGIFEAMIKIGIFIPRKYVFYDVAISGSKERRPGLDQVRALLGHCEARTLAVFTTNRLFRKNYKCMKFVEEEVVGRNCRAIFVRTGIDTAESDRWRLPLQVHALVDEMTSTMYSENIRAAHEGLFINRYVVSTLPFGYTGENVPGLVTKRQRPRQLIVIDDETAKWVRQIFAWYVEDRLPMARILEKLNEEKVPCGPKSDGSYWTHQALHYLLTNACYRGLWSYGKGKNVWQGKADYSKRVLRDKPLRQQQFEELRLVSDERWFRAQELLASSPQKNAGRKPRDGNTLTRPRILNGLLICKEHNRRLKVGGTDGHHMFCMACRTLPKSKRPLYSYLNRALALRLICRAIATAIQEDLQLLGDLIEPFLREVELLQRQDTGALDGLRKRLDKITRQIQLLMDEPGESPTDQNETKQRLRALRAERAVIEADIARLHGINERLPFKPTETEFRQLCRNVEEILLEAATGKEPKDAGAMRQILELLTGGRIEIEQMGERRAQRGWLRARFQLHLLATCSERLGLGACIRDDQPREIIVEIRGETIAEQHLDKVQELYSGGMLVTAIAEQLGIERHQVTDAIRIWHERNGIPPPEDGRVRRANVPNKLLNPAVFQSIADQVKALYDEGLLLEEVAARVGRDRGTVRSALSYWFHSRGLPMPDGRNRRKTLAKKNRTRSST